MRRLVAVAVVLGALLAQAALARAQPSAALAAEPRPHSGIGGVVVGSAGLGLAALNLVTMPICFARFYPAQGETACVVVSSVFAVGGLAVGIPSLLIGIQRRAHYRAWRQRRAQERRGRFELVVPSLGRTGMSLALRTRF